MDIQTTQIKEDEQHVKELEERYMHLHAIIERLSDAMEKANFSAYVEVLQNPWRVFRLNLLFGTARGLGMMFGMTVVFTLFVYTLSHLVDLPLVGKYIAIIVKSVHQELKK